MPHPAVSNPKQSDFLVIPDAPFAYWLQGKLLKIIKENKKLSSISLSRAGLTTGDSLRFIRYFWEIRNFNKYLLLAHGGSYQKWVGRQYSYLKWGDKFWVLCSLGNNLPSREYYYQPMFALSQAARGCLGARYISGAAFTNTSIVTIPYNQVHVDTISLLLNSRISSYYIRIISQKIGFEAGHFDVLSLPTHPLTISHKAVYLPILDLKQALIATDLTERSFSGVVTDQPRLEAVAATLHTLEGMNEREVFAAYGVAGSDMQAVLDETGIPAGWFPLIQGYDALPRIEHHQGESKNTDVDVLQLPQEALEHVAAHERIAPSAVELGRIKARLRTLYEAGPGAREDDESAPTDSAGDEESEGAVSGAHIPIPTETFLEELSVKLQLHPISIYWLLEELRREGARCKPEELRLLEDRLSVLVLRLLGHRWPHETEQAPGSTNKAHIADTDGIIPLTGGTGETTLAERLRACLRDEDGPLGAQRAESLLQELSGLSLDEWLRRSFFKRHVRQFKYRPVAWHLASNPSASISQEKGRKRISSRRAPAFECLLYYHACDSDILARLRTQYIEPLLRAARQHLESAHRSEQESEAAQTQERISELEDCSRRLRHVAEQGFASSELETLLAAEPLDRWDGDGYLPPLSHEALLLQERSWSVDINDGVRVNIAPLQLNGLLSSDVLKVADARKAIADRARWRSDERRWVRQGKLPRCGWMGEDVLESPEWLRLAPQREAERLKLEEKRRALGAQQTQQQVET